MTSLTAGRMEVLKDLHMGGVMRQKDPEFLNADRFTGNTYWSVT